MRAMSMHKRLSKRLDKSATFVKNDDPTKPKEELLDAI